MRLLPTHLRERSRWHDAHTSNAHRCWACFHTWHDDGHDKFVFDWGTFTALQAIRSRLSPLTLCCLLYRFMFFITVSGAPPSLAARYQIMICFLIAGCSCMSIVMSCVLIALVLVDSEHKLCPDVIQARDVKSAPGTIGLLLAAVQQRYASWRNKVSGPLGSSGNIPTVTVDSCETSITLPGPGSKKYGATDYSSS